MPETTVTGPGGKEFVVTHPEGASREDILAYAKEHAPGVAMPSRGGGMVPEPGDLTREQPAAFPGRTALEALANPQGPLETVATTALTALPIGKAGALAGAGAKALGATGLLSKAAPMAGRLAATGGISAARGDAPGEVAVNVAGAGIGEAGLGALGWLLGKGAKAFDGVKIVRDMIGKGPDAATNLRGLEMVLSDIGAAKTEAARELAERDGVAFLRKEFGDRVADTFKKSVIEAEAHVPGIPGIRARVPIGAAAAAAKGRGITENETVRAGLDAFLGRSPFSAVALGALPYMPGRRHLPGGHLLEREEK